MKIKITLGFFLLALAHLVTSQSLYIPGNLKYSENSNVGIGLTNPSQALEIYRSDDSQAAIQFGNLNTGTGSGNGFLIGVEPDGNGLIWNRKNSYIRFGTSREERIRILEDGKVGINTTDPKQLLDVEGIGRFNGIHLDVNGSIVGVGDGNFSLGEENEQWGFEGKCFSIGSNAPETWSRFQVNIEDDYKCMYLKNNDNNSNSHALFRIDCTSEQENSFRIQRDGNIGIGTSNIGDFKLAVNGKIRAKEIVVDTDWADFVFEEDYDLIEIEELKSFIKHNKHLPDIPSAREVENEGISIGDINSKLLQKIEELTLYVIDQNEQIKSLQQEVNKLKD